MPNLVTIFFEVAVPLLLVLLLVWALIVWIKRRGKGVQYSGSYEDLKPIMSGGAPATPYSQPSDTIYVDPDGNATSTPPHIASEPIESSGPIGQGKHMGPSQEQNMMIVRYLVRERKLNADDALKYQKEIEKRGEDVTAQDVLRKTLGAIDNATTSDTQEHDRHTSSDLDLIRKAYRSEFKRFRF
jgi:hypothetical protein